MKRACFAAVLVGTTAVVSCNAVDAPIPDLVIYLQASVDVLMRRLARRNAACDRFIERSYLERLTDAYARFFHAYDDGPLLIVNASQIDPVNNEADYEQLFQQIERTTGGRRSTSSTSPRRRPRPGPRASPASTS